MSRFVFWPLSAAVEEEAARLRADAAGLALLRAGWGVARLMAKANFNPAEARIPAGGPGGGRWTDAGGGTGYVRVAGGEEDETNRSASGKRAAGSAFRTERQTGLSETRKQEARVLRRGLHLTAWDPMGRGIPRVLRPKLLAYSRISPRKAPL